MWLKSAPFTWKMIALFIHMQYFLQIWFSGIISMILFDINIVVAVEHVDNESHKV